jgi:hypothetical protein
MSKSRLFVLVGLLALWPATARAEGWWGWLEELSGPGPFHGGGSFIRLFCVTTKPLGVDTCFSDGDARILKVIELRGGFLTSGERQRFADATADPNNTHPVHVVRFDLVDMVRVHKMLDVGGGVGFLRFSGDGFDPFYRFTVAPLSVSFTPFAFKDQRWSRVLRFRFDETYVTKGFNGVSDFNTRTSFSTGGEFLAAGAIVVDLASLVR